MRILHSGFAGVAQHTITLTEAPTLQFGDSKGASNKQLVSGGWGYVGAVTQGLLHLHGGQSTHILTGLPDESIAAAALTWQQALGISETGKLHECTLPVTQPAGNKAHEAEHVIVKWRNLDVTKPVTAVAAGELHSAALTADGTVWTWGSNTDCQLGRPAQEGSASDPNCPRAVAGPEAAHTGAAEADVLPSHLGGCQQAMVALACGARHTCAVGGMGQLFCWGWSLHGQCGQGRAVVTVPCPQVVAALGGLKMSGVAAGLGHTVACSDSGDVYSWGWNADGQLGLGDDQSRGEPELVADAQLQDLHIDQVSCGARHTLVKDQRGRAYSWGWNKYGQLGIGSTQACLVPERMQLEGSVNDIACGWWHSTLLVTVRNS